MAAFQLRTGEKLLINDPHAKWVMMEMKAIPGTIRLTNERFVFEKPENPYFGIFRFMFKKLAAEVMFEIKRSEITAATKAQGASGQSRLKIETKFERPKMFDTMKMETIIGELNKTINKEQHD